MKKIFVMFGLSCLLHHSYSQTPYKCGDSTAIKRPYGNVTLKVSCKYKSSDIISVAEYRGVKPDGIPIQNGFQIDYDSLWRRKDSSFYVNGKEEGTSLFWDSLGNQISKRFHKNGKPIGRSESFWSPGKPSNVTNYNDSGAKHGPELQWWRNGNKRLVAENKNGQMIYSEEYYQSGILRIRDSSKYNDQVGTELYRTISVETFSPSGKSTGKVINGNGEVYMFDTEPDKKTKRHRVLHIVYKDSIEVSSNEVSAKIVSKLMK